jgi:hypothetical protein
MVGGNGPEVTWRLAARFGDSLNLDALAPGAVEKALPVIAARCDEIGRDPSTLRVSVHLWGAPMNVGPGPARQRRLQQYAELGVERVIVQGFAAVTDPDALESLIDDCGAVGLLSA